jgi:hypothetical protein
MVKMRRIIIKSKRGWIRLIEVFIAILLMTGALLIVANRTNPSENNAEYLEISKNEIAILRNIELNNTLRTEILNAQNLPIEWESFGVLLPNVKSRIEYLAPPNLKCEAKICWINRLCTIEGNSEENIYAEAVVISADLNKFSPRQLKLFCIESEI